MLVVYDFVAHVDRRAEFFERTINDGDGAIHASAEAARVGEYDGFGLEGDGDAIHQINSVAWARCAHVLRLTLNGGHGVPTLRGAFAIERRAKRGPQHQGRADTDSRVGNVERGVAPVPRCPVDEYEIDDFAEPNAVDDVAERTADNEGKRELHTSVRLALEPTPAPSGNNERKCDEEPALPAACVRQKTECCAGVVGQYPIEKR